MMMQLRHNIAFIRNSQKFVLSTSDYRLCAAESLSLLKFDLNNSQAPHSQSKEVALKSFWVPLAHKNACELSHTTVTH
jgi:hypothetical protein